MGTMDGVHIGHQRLLEQTALSAEQSVALTFSPHPLQVIQKKMVPFVCSEKHRSILLQQSAIDTVIVVPFTEQLSQMPAEQFLGFLQKFVPFTHLILGHDAKFGKNQDGTREHIANIGKKRGFSTRYIDPVLLENTPVSSTWCRKAIQKGKIKTLHKLLGRPYSFQGTVVSGKSMGKTLGYPTANLEVAELCLPPLGVWASLVQIEQSGPWYESISNIGTAPTIRKEAPPILETHLLNNTADLKGKNIEVQLVGYIREEIAFPSKEALLAQIAADCEQAKLFY